MGVLYGGVDLGGTKIQAVVVDDENHVLGSARRPTPSEGGPAGVAAEIVQTLHSAASAAEADVSVLGGVGIGSPGIIDGVGNVSSARNLPGWEGSFSLASWLEQTLGVQVRVGNDVQVATDAEFKLGAGRPYASLLGVFWGTGVGGGIVLDGKAWTGRGGAGEIGHIVVRMGGAPCTCGRRGCLEAYAGRAAMERHVQRLVQEGRKTELFELMERRGKTRLTSGVWEHALDHEDELAQHIIDRAVRALGAGIASAVNLLDVECVIIGGGLGVRLGQDYAKRIAASMQPHLFAADDPPDIHVAALGDLGGALGATLLLSQPTAS